jgi:hypothetical protein
MRAIAILSIAPAEAPPVIADVARPWAGIVEIASQKTGYLNGYRGSRAQRAGYRRYRDGYWYPPAAFGAAITANLSATIVLDRPAIPARRVARAIDPNGFVGRAHLPSEIDGGTQQEYVDVSGRILPNSLIV